MSEKNFFSEEDKKESKRGMNRRDFLKSIAAGLVLASSSSLL